MHSFLAISQMVVSLALITLVLLQRRGTGLGGIFGGEGGSWHERRGLEKLIFWLTVVLAVLFVVISFFSLIAST